MDERRDEGLDPRLRWQLESQYGTGTPPPDLEEKVVTALRGAGLSGPPRRASWWRRAAAVAAALAVFVLGLWAGGRLSEPGPAPAAGSGAAVPAQGESLYLLLLLEPAGAPLVPADQEAAVVEEYRAWAGAQARAGRLVRGEKLGDAVRRLGPATAERPGRVVTGFFLLRAGDLEGAMELAESCPHLRHGGSIEVRPVEST